MQMGLSAYNIKRWTRMIAGKSIYHVDQNIGTVFKPGELNGYFNDLTQKVLLGGKNLESNGIPFLEHSDGSHVQMPTMIFQYGLGAYDLWLIRKDREYLDKAILCADWAIEHQEENGAWSTFFYIYPESPYSSMPQGEAVSLLVRIYKETNEDKYMTCAYKALHFMLSDISEGGVSNHNNGDLIFLEYTHLPVVLNGWIFAAFGLYDASLIDKSYKENFLQTINTLARYLPKFDSGYWSLYDIDGKVASPFYHNLHIAQLKALCEVSENETFRYYYKLFGEYQSAPINKMRAFIKKAIQKIEE